MLKRTIVRKLVSKYPAVAGKVAPYLFVGQAALPWALRGFVVASASYLAYRLVRRKK